MKYIKSIVSNSIHFKELENSVLFILDDGFKFFHYFIADVDLNNLYREHAQKILLAKFGKRKDKHAS